MNMNSLTNRRILVGISGGIAAYKSAELVRELVRAGADVRVVMTAGAMEFITPLTLQALSGHPVHHALLDPEAEAGMGHIELARWADAIVIAPASANLISRLAQGMGNDLLTTLVLAAQSPLLIAPAMNQAMWSAASTQSNLEKLQQLFTDRLTLIGPAAGSQACGDIGLGRMEEPTIIAQAVADCFESLGLAGKKVVITAGPTREAIDPVRYISNHSSGKMGYALAAAARDAGAQVILISGPVQLACPDRVECISVVSADNMLAASQSAAVDADIVIAAAAVADYRPKSLADQKIKKSTDEISLELVKNPDIVATIAALPQPERPSLVVGFAAETQQVEAYALGKLERKNLDMIIANDVSDTEIGFNSDDNAVTAYWGKSDHQRQTFKRTNKNTLAVALMSTIAEQLPNG